MKILDTHLWIWLVDQNPQLTKNYLKVIQQNEADGLGLSVISCWETAKHCRTWQTTTFSRSRRLD